MRKFIPNIIFSAILIAFVIQDHKERESEALTPATDQLAPVTYRGLLPAADCAGIDYILTLNDSIAGADTLFALRMVYIAIGKTDFLYKANREYRKLLDEKGYPYEYFENEDGHIWRNWRIYLTEFTPKLFK